MNNKSRMLNSDTKWFAMMLGASVDDEVTTEDILIAIKAAQVMANTRREAYAVMSDLVVMPLSSAVYKMPEILEIINPVTER